MNTIPLLECRHVSKAYQLGDNSIEALKQVSFTVSSGEFVALKGPSGSGKSTLLNICGMLDTVDNGLYLFKGDECHNAKLRTAIRRQCIGFVFQNFGLIPVMTAYENIEYPLLLLGVEAKIRKKSVDWIMDAVGINGVKQQQPDQLSGGQKQRVAIARALVKKPSLVIADEPTANLDTATAESVINLMKSLSSRIGTTFLIATHDERMCQHCDRVLVLTDGILS